MPDALDEAIGRALKPPARDGLDDAIDAALDASIAPRPRAQFDDDVEAAVAPRADAPGYRGMPPPLSRPDMRPAGETVAEFRARKEKDWRRKAPVYEHLKNVRDLEDMTGQRINAAAVRPEQVGPAIDATAKGHAEALPAGMALAAHLGRTVASGTTLGFWKGGLTDAEDRLVSDNPTVRGPAGSAVGAAGTVLAAANPLGPVVAATRGAGALGAGRLAPAIGFGVASGVEHRSVEAGLEAAIFVGAAGAAGKLLKGKGPGFIRRVAGEAAAVLGVGAGMSTAKGEPIDWSSQAAQAALFGVLSGFHASPLTTRQENVAAREASASRRSGATDAGVRPAREPSPLNPDGIGIDPTRKIIASDPNVDLNPDRIGIRPASRSLVTPSREAVSKAVTEAVETGRVDPREAFSPERIEVVKAAVDEGRDPVAALEARPETVRPDGSVEGPAGQPIETAKIDPVVKPLVDDMRARGIDTVSSDRGLDGAGVVIGIDQAGRTVVERGGPAEAPSAPAEARPEAPVRPAPKPQSVASIEREAGKVKSLAQLVRAEGGFDYNRSSFKGELDVLRQKDSGSSGLVKTKAKGGKSDEELMQAAREAGFDIPADMNGGDFARRVMEDVESGGRDRSPEAGDIDARMVDVEYRRAMQAAEQQRADMEAMVPKLEPTSIANEPIRQSREGRGLHPIEKGPKRPWKQVVEEARSALDAEPKLADHLLREIDSGKRIPSDTDVAVLTIHRMNLREQVAVNDARGEHAAKYGDVEGAAMAKDRAVELESDLSKTDFLYDLAGGDAGRALAARKMEMAQDYSVEAIKTKMRRQKNYEPLSDADVVEARDLAKRYADAVKERDAYKARAEKAEADLVFGEHPASRKAPVAKGDKTYGAKNKIVTKDAADAALARILERARNPQSNIGFDPTVIKDYIIRGAFHVEAGARKLADWTTAMVSEFGDEVRPHLDEIWTGANKHVRDVALEGISAKAREGFAEGKTLDKMPGTVKDLAELVINSGVHGREPVTDAVHEIVKSLDPSITRDAVREALTGYGKVRKLDMDPAKVELREITAETLELLKLRDMEAGKPPKATGNQRQPPSDAKRELTKKVNEAKKKYGYDVTDPATQLKTANDAVETRWRNEIADMDRQIAAGKKDIPVKSDLVLTESAKAMKAARDKKKAEYEAVFGKPGLTDVQRTERLIAVKERSIKEMRKRATAGDVFREKKAPQQGPMEERLAKAVAEQKDLRTFLADMRDAANPKLSENDKVIRRLQRQLAKLKEQVATGDVMPKERVVKPRSPEAIRLEAEVLMAKKAVNEAIFQRHLAARTGIQRAGAAALEVTSTARALMTSFDVSAVLRQGGIVAMSHPVRAFKALGEMFRAFKSPEAMARSEAELTMRPTYSLAKRSGLFLAEHGDVRLAKMEENYQSRWAQHIPGVAGSQRAYTTFLNRIRMDSFDAMIRNLSKDATPTKAEAEAVAQYVNVATGRGGWKGEKVLTALNQAFFSPRLVASRFQYLAGPFTGFQTVGGGSMRVRGLVATEYARFFAGSLAVIGLGLLAGGKIDTDSRSSDFMKLRFGNTRLDTLEGLQQVAVFEERIRRGKTRSIDGTLRKTDLGIVTNFARSKAAPIPGAAISAYLKRDPTGQKTNLGREALGLVTPMSLGGKNVWFDHDEIYAEMKKQGVPASAALWILQMFGMGVSNYKKRRR